MRIGAIDLYRIQIPFKKAFKHARRERSTTDNIVIATELQDGSRGYGESLPREYVTGETQESVITAIERLDSDLFEIDLNNLEDLISYLKSELLSQKNLPYDRQNNSARCALELSLLDAYCQSFKKSFLDMAKLILGNNETLKRVPLIHYDGVLSLDSWANSIWSAIKMRLFGFRKLKIKVGADIDLTLRTIRNIRRIVAHDIDLRIDANEAWTLEQAIEMADKLKPFSISSIEQPLPHSEIEKMSELRKASSIPLMLDESLCTIKDADRAIKDELCDLFNIRISKCGGFINSMKIAQLARENGLGYQLGCMVGETGILSAAGRQFATIDPFIRYLEGSYDRYLLRDNIIREEISFGRGGEAHAIEGYGLGVHVDPTKLSQYSVYRKKLIA